MKTVKELREALVGLPDEQAIFFKPDPFAGLRRFSSAKSITEGTMAFHNEHPHMFVVSNEKEGTALAETFQATDWVPAVVIELG